MSLFWSLSQAAWLSHDEKSSNPFNRLSNQVDMMNIYDTILCKKISCSISLLLVSQFYKHRTVLGSDQVWASRPLLLLPEMSVWTSSSDAEDYTSVRPPHPPAVLDTVLRFLRQKYHVSLQ